ncbi:UNVERIFIED_ORG: GMP synthase-like glutamine amidotransferase [Rhodococcus erythropolis]
MTSIHSNPEIRAKALVVMNASPWSMGWLSTWLPDSGVDLEVVRPFNGESLPHKLDHDCLIILPGVFSVNKSDEAPWYPQVRKLIVQAIETDRPVLGICLGAQLISTALGGSVSKGSSGPEYGLVSLHPYVGASEDRLFNHLGTSNRAIVWHYEGTIAIPKDAVPLLYSSQYEYEAYRYGENIWALQFHPEAALSSVKKWARSTVNELRDLGMSGHGVLAQFRCERIEIFDMWRRTIQSFAGLCLETAAHRQNFAKSILR